MWEGAIYLGGFGSFPSLVQNSSWSSGDCRRVSLSSDLLKITRSSFGRTSPKVDLRRLVSLT